jgi:hypothetical protein
MCTGGDKAWSRSKGSYTLAASVFRLIEKGMVRLESNHYTTSIFVSDISPSRFPLSPFLALAHNLDWGCLS